MRDIALDVPRGLTEVCHPDRLALIVYDMQSGIVSQMNGAPAILPKVIETLAAARDSGFRVIFTRHLSMPKKLMGRFQLRQAMAWQHTSDPDQVRPWFLRGSPGFEIVPELAPRDDEAILDKIAFSAFEGTPLATILRDCGLISFAIVGVATEIGIDPTIRHGADLGFIPVMVQDACGAGHAEAGQWSVSALTFMGDAIMTDTAAFAVAAAESNRSK
jgi:nicotinamidase-related amidase